VFICRWKWTPWTEMKHNVRYTPLCLALRDDFLDSIFLSFC
jgi:hypothetical protein